MANPMTNSNPMTRFGPETRVSTQITTGIVQQAKYVAVVGSREYPEPERVTALIGLLHPEVTVVSGGTRGVDRAAGDSAVEQGRKVAEVFPRIGPDATRAEAAVHLKARNTVIVRGSDVVVAFWDGKSNGTADAIEKALQFHNFVIVALPGRAAEVWERYKI